MARIDTNGLTWGIGLGAAYILAPRVDSQMGTSGKLLSVKNVVEVGAPIIGVIMQTMNFKADMGQRLTAAGTARATERLYELATGVRRMPVSARVAARQPASAGAGDYEVR